MIDLDDGWKLGELIEEVRRISIVEARRRGLAQADTEDVAQTVGLKFWQYLKKKKEVRSVEAWVRKATANRIIDLHRRALRLKNGPGIIETMTNLDETRIAKKG